MSRFFVDFFCLAVPKNVAGEPSCAVFRKVSGGEKVCGREGRGGGEYQNFLPKTFCLSAEKIGRGTLYGVTDFGYRKS